MGRAGVGQKRKLTLLLGARVSKLLAATCGGGEFASQQTLGGRLLLGNRSSALRSGLIVRTQLSSSAGRKLLANSKFNLRHTHTYTGWLRTRASPAVRRRVEASRDVFCNKKRPRLKYGTILATRERATAN